MASPLRFAALHPRFPLDPELAGFCIIARGSASELEYQLLLARDLKLIQLKDYETLSEQTVEIKRMLTVLVQKLTAER